MDSAGEFARLVRPVSGAAGNTLGLLISPAVHPAGSGTACELPGGQRGGEDPVWGPSHAHAGGPGLCPAAPRPESRRAESAACGRRCVLGSRAARSQRGFLCSFLPPVLPQLCDCFHTNSIRGTGGLQGLPSTFEKSLSTGKGVLK